MPIVSEDVLKVGFDGVVASAGRHIEIDGKVIRDSAAGYEIHSWRSIGRRDRSWPWT